jgi:5-methyltetrahydrofolate--homocysteine methyltransferase
LAEISEYIDWSPFFATWEMAGTYPKIFESERYGAEAKTLFDDAQKMLQQIIDEKWITAKGVIGLLPANTIDDDDIVVFDENGHNTMMILHHMRQQTKKAPGIPNMALSDYVAPKTSGKVDYIGAFAVTSGIGIEAKIEEFEKKQDDYSSILLKALADRLAEAFAERMHQRVRKEFWGYAAEEVISREELVHEKYQGIRPAPGYAACPDHTEKTLLWELLKVKENTGILLTESNAMYPASSVSGFYFSHPQSRYFGVGKIEKDQVESLAQRKEMAVELMEKWLQSNLSYE